MLKFGDRVTVPRSWHETHPVEGVITGLDLEDPEGWVYQVTREAGNGPVWVHKDETVLVPDASLASLEFALATEKASVDMLQGEKDAQEERIAQLTIELANTQVQMERHKALAEHWEAQYNQRGKVYDEALAGMARLSTTIAALKALVCDVSDAAAAKEAIWFATEAYNQKAEKARATLAAIEAQDGKLSWYSSRSGE